MNLQIEQELDEIKKKHNLNRKIKKELIKSKVTKTIIITILVLTIIICFFVLINKSSTLIDRSGYEIKVNYAEFEKHNLILDFDPNFTTSYQKLIGLGYGESESNLGNSLLDKVGMNLTAFDYFKRFVKEKDVADVFQGNEGEANFDQFYCNKYYIKNTGDSDVYFRLNLKITENINNALDAARFMISTNNFDDEFNYKVLATINKDTNMSEIVAYKNITEIDYIGPIYIVDPNISDEVYAKDFNKAWYCENLFLDPNTLFYHYYSANNKEELYKLGPNQMMCFNVCIWFEASDIDHNNSIIGGGISFSLIYETLDYLMEKDII